jgi:hypothetical protein
LTTAQRGAPRSSPLQDGGATVAGFLAAGFLLRALGHVIDFPDPVQRLGVAATVALLYCIGFGYALLGLTSARRAVLLHLGATGLAVGAILESFLGTTPFGQALIAGGVLMMMSALAHVIRRSEDRVYRLAVFVAAVGPVLFALHAFVFAAGADALAARFLRLGATAAMALPLLAMLYRITVRGDTGRAARAARALFAIGMVAMPMTLVLSSLVDERAKYALGPASDCFTVGLMIACFQAWRRTDRPSLAGFGIVLASMLLGKLMGFYAFDGPLPAPAALAAYADAWRVSLRHFHIDLMVIGYSFLLWPALVRLRVVGAGALALAMALLSPGLGAWATVAAVAVVAWLIVFWRGRVAA